MRAKKQHILVVDDDQSTCELVRLILERAGYPVSAASDSVEALKRLYDMRPSLIILDVTMPGLDGFQLLDRIRGMTDTPVLMLTARTLVTEKVQALKIGADDYVSKPFDNNELLARVEALLRRSQEPQTPADSYHDSLLTVDFAQQNVTVDGTNIRLTPLEFKLLSVLVNHPNQVLSRDQLGELVWNDSEGTSRDEVKVYIGYLRRKLKAAAEVDPIESVRGFGYSYHPPNNR